MAAIITNKFRINNAEQFVESFSETAATTYYLFIGRSHSWASDADAQGNTIAEGTDASPPTPMMMWLQNFTIMMICWGQKLLLQQTYLMLYQEETGQQEQHMICMNII